MALMRLLQNGWIKLLLGIVLVGLLLSGVVAWLPGYIATYGATENEIAATYPGDEILNSPVIMWTHGASISAPPEKVWPWIAQIGQSRGGFYSYTFIENMISRDGSYKNAPAILPQFQDPKPGVYIIADMLPIKEVKTGEYFLAAVDDFFGMGWTWGWYLRPEGTASTRLILRMKIQTSGEQSNPAAMWIINAGGFIMEKAMLRGITDRAEGRPFPSPNEPFEIVAWFGTLIIGLASAWQVIRRKNWLFPLLLGLTSVAALLVITFIQPSIILRIVILIILGLAFLAFKKREENPEEKEQK
jgi:hypothetical protein